MAISPIQYLPQPKQFGLEQGLAIGQGIRNIRAEQAKQEALEQAKLQADELKKQYSADLQAAWNSPDKTRAFAELTTKYPSQREAFKQSMSMLSEQEKDNQIKVTSQIYTALQNNKPEIATNILDGRIEARRNAGEDVTELETLRDNMMKDPENAKSYAGMILSSAMGPDKFVETFGKLGEEQRKKELQPGEIKKQNAELKKFGAELGLKEADINKSLASTRKLDAETKKILLELEAESKAEGKIVDPVKKNKAERELRAEYSKETADYVKTQDAFRKINAAEDTAVGDLSLIFSFMKMLDPGSVVREGEFATAQNAAGVDEKVINLYNNVISGERLNEKQRKSFRSQAKSLLDAGSKKEKETRSVLMNPIKNYGLNPSNVFGGQEEVVKKETTETETPTGANIQSRSYLKYAGQ